MSAALWRYTVVSCFIRSVCSQGTAVLTFNSDTVYAGEPFTLTCSCGDGVTVTSMIVEAFNKTNRVGTLWCNGISSPNTTNAGVFIGSNFTGCPGLLSKASNISVSLTATPAHELTYQCFATVSDINSVTKTLESNFAFLSVLALPETPTLLKMINATKENDNASIVCESRKGKPVAAIRLTVTNSRGRKVVVSGEDYVSLSLPPPVTDWQNATALCNVTNHELPDLAVYTDVEINYIMKDCSPEVVDTSAGNVTLDCTTCTRSYPNAIYSWSAQLDSDITGSSMIHGSSTYSVTQGQSGLFFCIATNPITTTTIVLAFAARATKEPERPGCYLWWIVVSVESGIIIISAVVFGAVCKSRSNEPQAKEQSGAAATEQTINAISRQDSNNQNYETTIARSISQRTYAQINQRQYSTEPAEYENFQRHRLSL